MPRRRKKGNRAGLAVIVGLAAALAVGLGAWIGLTRGPVRSEADTRYVAKPRGQLTFNRDVAPIVFKECANCHRPGQSAPFSLLTFQDVKERGGDIVKVTESHYMPPWLPERGSVELADERYLNAEQIGIIGQWVAEGMVEGSPTDKPALPPPHEDWQFGTPDLIVQMPQAYTLPAAGQDIYRNFVIPTTPGRRRFVRAVEFKSDTTVIHHALLFFDRTRRSRRMDAEDSEVGFPGMSPPPTVESPGGYFLSWQPGRGPTRSPEGLAWPMEPGSDLVLLAHMQPNGKPQKVQPRVAFYFTDVAPTNQPFKIVLNSYGIDIPPGMPSYEVQQSYVLPVEVDLLAVLPHAHYLGKELQCYAVLPDGEKQWLLKINNWDFNWQSDFRYRQPIHLPKGTRLAMRFVYDNSEENARNPNRPPVRVKFGLQSTDEMAEIWLQMLSGSPDDLRVLQEDYGRRVVREVVEFNTLMLQRNPSNAHAHVQLGKALVGLRPLSEAVAHFRRAVEIDPDEEEGHYHLGLFTMDTEPATAEMQFMETIRVNPENFKARNNLGLVLMHSGRFSQAENQFQEALRLNPGDRVVLENLNALSRARAVR